MTVLLVALSAGTAAALAAGTAAASSAPAATAGETVAVQAGTIHRVADGEVLTGGATLLVRDGKIEAIGSSVELPAGTRVVDYGPDAVIVPGLVCADSTYGASFASPRTAAPTVRAIDNFDPYTPLLGPAKAGVTSVFLVPARARLIAGQGAVVKTSGEAGDARVVAESALLVGSITADARRTPGYWEVPVPATVDVGLGTEQPQLPRSTMGAVVALEELLALQAGDADLEAEYGWEAAHGLRALVDAGTTWRMDAESPEEIRALLDCFGRMKLPLALAGASGAAELAGELAAAGVPVLAAPPLRGGEDFGKGEDAPWPRYDTISRLVRAGVRVAIVPPPRSGPEDLRLAAGLAMRGGMSAGDALRAITLTPAEILGVADRLGSLAPGKDADFVVLNGPPLAATSGVTATWVSGEIAWKPRSEAGHEPGAEEERAPATVIEVEELYLGDGEILRPGQVLLQGGRIAEVGPRVAHPKGSVVVRGAAAMPGMIDSFGHLGLEGSEKGFSARFDLRRLVEPGDVVDRKVARAGVTTVNLGPRRDSNGSPTMAYKPADEDPARMVLAAPATWRMVWSNEIRASSGESVKKDLAKALEYKQKWEQYEKDRAAWDPSKAGAAEGEEKEKDEEAEGEAADEKKDETADKDEKKEEDKKDSKKKKDEPPAPVTGEWNGHFGSGEEAPALRVRLLERELALEGTARIEGREPLFVLSGARADAAVTLRAEGGGELADLALTLEGSALKGTWTEGDAATEVALERTSDVYPVAGRPDRPRPAPVASPKGEPKPPGVDPDLEPLRQAMLGKGSIVVVVTHPDEILDCVAEFEKVGIRPVLWDAPGAARLAPRIRDRIAGVVTRRDLAALAAAGIPVAFFSAAEEGAVELPLQALAAVANGLSPTAALRALTGDAAALLGLAGRIGTLSVGGEGDLLLLDGPPLEPATSVLRVWVSGEEVR